MWNIFFPNTLAHPIAGTGINVLVKGDVLVSRGVFIEGFHGSFLWRLVLV